MDYFEFQNRVIDEGIAAAKTSYTSPDDSAKLHGSVAGFEVCRDKNPLQLQQLYLEAGQSSREALHAVHEKATDTDTYWFKRCYMLEVEWVCNVVSAMLLNQGVEPIVMPTARGVMKAVSIAGVKP